MVVLQEKTRIPFSSRWTGAVRRGAASAVMEVSVPQLNDAAQGKGVEADESSGEADVQGCGVVEAAR
ncbi:MULTISPECIES: hypothetical protein [unclassified Streptomyces]|uniref:hypothetical protein n=1 Tax=unclassified Streptomyces TaxID=2593676 RepID=UPI0015CF06BF|nr:MULTISPECIES: hypothetical protein [unclassified Streptomyces]